MEPRVYIIEGPSKIGKSSQAFLLSQTFEQKQIFNMDRVMSVEEVYNKINDLKQYLKSNEKNIAILTGSVAYTIVKKDLETHAFGKSYLDYDDEIRDFLEVLKTYRYRAFLLKPNNMDFLSKRKEDFNSVEEDAIYKGLKHFENLYSNASFRWVEIPVSAFDNVLEIQKKIRSSI